MSELILNASVIASLKNPETGQKFVWTSKLKGFGIRLTKNMKTYVCESRVKGRKRRITNGLSSIFNFEPKLGKKPRRYSARWLQM